MVSSFVPETISAMSNCLKGSRDFMLCRLLNRKNLAPIEGLIGYLPSEETDGVNISATYLTEEIVELVHNVGKTIGVWLERAATKET